MPTRRRPMRSAISGSQALIFRRPWPAAERTPENRRVSLPLTAPARLPTDIDEDTTMISRRNLIGGSAILAGAAAVSGRVQAAAVRSVKRTRVSARRHTQWLVASLADQWRLEGISFGCGAGHTRDRARHESPSVGLQRSISGTDPGIGRRRQGPHLCHQQVARAHNHSLARHAGAKRNGWCWWIDAAAHQTGSNLRLRVRYPQERDIHVSPARGRDGADGYGDDGLHRGPPARSQSAPRRPRLRLPHEQL